MNCPYCLKPLVKITRILDKLDLFKPCCKIEHEYDIGINIGLVELQEFKPVEPCVIIIDCDGLHLAQPSFIGFFKK